MATRADSIKEGEVDTALALEVVELRLASQRLLAGVLRDQMMNKAKTRTGLQDTTLARGHLVDLGEATPLAMAPTREQILIGTKTPIIFSSIPCILSWISRTLKISSQNKIMKQY